ncbi:MAG: hypothetical protein ALECFALPRED_000516 [Alectoria fallacina]|uniref:Aminoglycoside phosphotransferase domain-containing protein n=1 Tax=Alectoria fallacina TaxID=1903189 RepID=A0A8H3PK43_9LECA|nr:MAG: hypothetical protein ALECFALPRED_000516 [Alectoria fallacina]
MAYPSHKNDQISMLGLYEEDMNRFGRMLRTMNLDSIPDFASNVRQYGHRSTGNSPIQDTPEPCLISCKIINPPLCGSFHIVFPIEFADGVKWMLKISANGDHFDSVAAAALASEAQTMQMLRRETSIPVPVVYAFDASSNNALSTPFILMEKLGGRPLTHLWFDSEKPKARLEHFRVKALQSLAKAMVQLNKFTLNTGGSLVFDSDGTPVGLGGAKVLDGVASFNKARVSEVHQEECDEGGDITPDETSVDAAMSKNLNMTGCGQADADNSDDDDIICERGPFNYSKAYFLSNLDRSDPAFRADAYERGTDMSLRLFIEWAFAESRNHERRFVLAHPDLDVQNILAAEDGTLTGLIDWDGVAAVPREVGCAQYPLWLMRDWVPLRYNYNTEKGEPCEDAGYEESSPAELASYRAIYAQMMEVEVEKMTGGPDKTTTIGTLPKHEADLTRRSLIMRSLDLSAGDPWAALRTVNHIIDQIEDLTAPNWEETDSDLDTDSSYSSASDSDRIIDGDCDEEDTEAEVPTTSEQSFSGVRGDTSAHQANQEYGGMACVVSEVSVKAGRSSWGVAERKQVPSNSLEAYQTDFEEPKTKDSSKVALQEYSSTPSAPLGWTRRLLRFGCDTAEKSLRRIAKIGYALKDNADEMVDMATADEVQHAEDFGEIELGQVVDSDTREQICVVEFSEDTGTKVLKHILSAQDTGGLDQLNKDQSIETAAAVQETPSNQAVDSDQVERIALTQAAIEPQDIPLRKAELLQAARTEKKAERKAHYRHHKAAIKKELKVWEHIALAVWRRGISLEQLQMNQGKIARWVVDTLGAEQEHEDGLTANIDLSPETEETAAAARMMDSNAATLSLLEDNLILSRAEQEEGSPGEKALQTAKAKRDEPLEASKVSIAGVVGNNGLESKVHQISLEKGVVTPQDGSPQKNSIFDIFEDNEDEPAPPIAISSTTQHQAGLYRAQNSRTSKPDGCTKRTKNRPAAKRGKMSPALRNENPSSSKLSAYTSGSNTLVTTNQSEVPSEEEELAGGSIVGRKNMMLREEAAWGPTKAIEMQQLSESSSTSGDHVTQAEAKASYGLRALCKSGASYISQIFFNHNQSKEDKVCLSPGSSVFSDSGQEEGGSDIGDAHSSATSLSDSEAEDRENAKIKEDKDDTPELTAIAVDEDGEGEDSGNDGHEENYEDGREGRINEAIGQTNHHSPAAVTKGSFKEHTSVHSHAPQGVCRPYSGDWVEANGINETTEAGSLNATDDEAQVGEVTEPGDGENGDDANHEDDQENRAGKDQGEESSIDGDAPEFEDHGGFDHYTICNLLGMGELDELRLLRLKDGFLKLLEQY